MPASAGFAEASCMRSPASSSRLTTGCVWKTLPSPTSSQQAHGPCHRRRRWAEFARQVGYKAAWFGTELVVGDRWFPSTKTCSRCGKVNHELRLAERVFFCHRCGLVIDRDRNAATNLATWAQAAQMRSGPRPAKQAAGSPMPLEGKALAVALAMVKPAPMKGEPTRTPSWCELRTPEKGAADHLLAWRLSDRLRSGSRPGPGGRWGRPGRRRRGCCRLRSRRCRRPRRRRGPPRRRRRPRRGR